MGRLPRLIDNNLIYHAFNRGNNCARVFSDESDYQAFLEILGRTRSRYPFRLHGYCLMPDHIHLLVRPETDQSISRILQSLTVSHTARHHQRHRSSGHVWQGRFKSPVIQDDIHLLIALRYIEAIPRCLGLVADPAEYAWSSFQYHGLGRDDRLLAPFPAWNELGRTEKERQSRWRRKVRAIQDETEAAAVRLSLQNGRPLGTARWVASMAKRLDIDLTVRPRGRPRKETRDGKRG
jgi:putative transposase